MLVVANFCQLKLMQKAEKITETLAHLYSSESIQQELSNKYQHDRFSMFFQKSLHPCAFMKVALVLEVLDETHVLPLSMLASASICQ